MTDTEQKYYALLIMRFNDVYRIGAAFRSFCRALGVPGGSCTAVCCLVWGSIPHALLWPCVPCIRAFDGPLIIPYRNNSSGVYGPLCGLFMPCFAMVL